MSLTLEDFHLSIPTSHGAVEPAVGISLTLRPGTVHGLIGASGSGKSTTGLALLGMVPPGSTVSGTLTIDGTTVDLSRRSGRTQMRALRGRTVGFVPQSPATSFTPVRRVGPQIAELIPRGSATTVAALFEKVHLDPAVAQRYPHELSGGMAQRVALAAALAGDPTVLIADEPTSALDPDLTLGILMLLAECARSDGMSVLLISHDLQDLIDTHVLNDLTVLRRGRVVDGGSAAEIFHQPQVPYTQALLAALPRGGVQLTPGFEKG